MVQTQPQSVRSIWQHRPFLQWKTVPVFILGCQRSGTTICQNVFLGTNRFSVYKEGDQRAMTGHWRLRPLQDIRKIIDNTRGKVVVFKPINDSQNGAMILQEFPESRIVWIYRSVGDTVNSAVAKWGAAQRDMVVWIGNALREHGTLEKAMPSIFEKPDFAIYAEGLSEETCERLKEWTAEPVSVESGAAIMWYVRNHLYFDQALQTHPRALLVNYEKFARAPDEQLRRMCEFMQTRTIRGRTKKVHTHSIDKAAAPPISPDVYDACEALHARLEEVEGSDHRHTI